MAEFKTTVNCIKFSAVTLEITFDCAAATPIFLLLVQ